jgi:hypothetical protein
LLASLKLRSTAPIGTRLPLLAISRQRSNGQSGASDVVARTHPEPHGLVVRFTSNGEEPIVEHAHDAREALWRAVSILIARRTLLAGDRLSIHAGDAGEDEVISERTSI